MEQQTREMKMVWTMVERTPSAGGAPKTFWTKIGVGFVNRDGSITLRLDAIPVNGTMQVREWEPYERRIEGEAAARTRTKGQPPASDSLL